MSSGVEEGKLFVGGLSWDTTKDGLKEYFSQFGVVTDAVIMIDGQSRKPRGFGFVTFEDPSCAQTALTKRPHILDNKTIDPKPATNKQAQSGGGAGAGAGPQSGVPTDKVFVGGLSLHTTEDGLTKFFSDLVGYEHVTKTEIKVDHTTGRSRGFGFVTFSSPDVAESMLTKQYRTIDDKEVEVKRAEQKGSGQSYGARQGMMGGPYQGQGYGQYNEAMYQGGQYPQAGQYHHQQQQQQFDAAGYYGSAASGYSGNYGTAMYGSYHQSTPAQRQQPNYSDQGYAAGYSRTDSASYNQQQQFPGYQQQGYGNTSGNTGSRGQQPQSGYGYGNHGMH